MNTKEELKKLLKKINASEDPESIKPEVKEKLRGINPTDLSQAEQELAEEEDIGVEEIRQLCEPHLEIMEGEDLKDNESDSRDEEREHPRNILESEHEVLLDKLDELDEIIDELDTMEDFDDLGEYLDRLKDISRHLLDAESHHNREEEALFPAVEKKGLTGPTEVMREEHDDYLEKKKALGKLIENRDDIDFEEFVQKLKRLGTYLVEGMNNHIYKENNILYPAAGDVLAEEEWSKIKSTFDEMGYTFFAPVEQNQDKDSDSEYEIGEELDLRGVPPSERHPRFFRKFDSLQPGQKLVLLNDHEPKPLFYEMKAEREERFVPESYQVFKRGENKYEAHFPKKGNEGS